jgi:hypothetical protein
MSIRIFSIVLLAIASALVSAVVVAVSVFVARLLDWPAEAWLAPLMFFVSSTLVFFLGRHYVLPPHLTSTFSRALLVVAGWSGAAMLLTAAAVLAVRQAGVKGVTGGGAIAVVWLLLIVALGSFIANREQHGRLGALRE